jgi:hypothetical protein
MLHREVSFSFEGCKTFIGLEKRKKTVSVTITSLASFYPAANKPTSGLPGDNPG